MSAQDRKNRTTRIPNKAVIAAPPRVALSGAGRSSRTDGTDHRKEGKSNEPSPESTPETVPIMKNENVASRVMDRDDRIAYLEKEMAVMEGEFSRELELLGKKITDESELAIYWQQKHSTINQKFLKTDTNLQVLKHEAAVKEKQMEERDKDVMTRISSLLLERESLREGYHVLQTQLDHRDDEIKRLRSQVKGLKDFVSTNSRTDGQVTDEVLGEMMQKIGNSLQNWVIQSFRKAKLNPLKAEEKTRDTLLSLVPTYESQISSARIYLIQSLISRLLTTTIFENFFVGLPGERASELRNIEEYLASMSNGNSSSSQWRATTLAAIRKELSPDAKESAIETLLSTVNQLMGDLTDVTASEARDQALGVLIKDAIELSQLLRVQKAVFKYFMPVIEGHQITVFDAESMEDMGGEDEDTLQGREIRCVTFPGIIKQGDESGENSQLRNVIAKARVLCSPD